MIVQASSAADLSDGLAMSEVLVQIEPATFTPTWFAGILKSSNSGDTLSVLLNMLLHYYRYMTVCTFVLYSRLYSE